MDAKLEATPREQLLDSVVSSWETRMPTHSRGVKLLHDTLLKSLVVPNPQTAFVMDQAIA
jgi:hypothetical protein